MSDIEIEIDGKTLTAKPNTMVIQVADEAGIYIPRFCYHKLLSVAANCRMCLVEVEKSPKPLPACATPIMPGMKVFTRSPKAIAAQRAVMEFLLINHPLDCPICDQGGECELQDLSMGYGPAKSFYHEGKRSVKDQNIGPLIATDMTRCIQCTRCVRFGDEVAGLRELGATGRGENMEITTYVQHAMHSEVSGNIIDLCPVGALTSKPYRFTARGWELSQYPSIAPHDCVGSNINVHTRVSSVMRVVPRENLNINETWISDRDRYSYEALAHPDRIGKPLVRVGFQWQETDWQIAFERIASGLQKVLKTSGPDSMGALTSPNATVEELYLLQKLMRGLGSHNIDHRLRQVDFKDQNEFPLFPGLNGTIPELETYERIILIGSNIQKEQPSLALRIRKASLKGAEIISINMLDYRFHFALAVKKVLAPHEFVDALASITEKNDHELTEKLAQPKKTAIILGALAFNHPEASTIRALASRLAQSLGGALHFLTEGANAAGAWIAGAIPHRGPAGAVLEKKGLDAQAMLKDARKAYLLLNVEPDLDCANAVTAFNSLKAADFVVALSLYKNPVLEQLAHVILPIAPFTETSGTFVNAEGAWQSFQGVAKSFEESRPAWKVLRVLGNFLDLTGFEYTSSEEVLNELKGLQIHTISSQNTFKERTTALKNVKPKWSRIGEIPLYATDSIVRRASALQAAQTIIEGDLATVRIHPKTAATLDMKEGEMLSITQNDNVLLLPVLLDARVPLAGVFIAGGMTDTSVLPELFGPLTMEKA